MITESPASLFGHDASSCIVSSVRSVFDNAQSLKIVLIPVSFNFLLIIVALKAMRSANETFSGIADPMGLKHRFPGERLPCTSQNVRLPRCDGLFRRIASVNRAPPTAYTAAWPVIM